jgi:hypothetical protein
VINALWLLAIAFAFGYGSIPGLLTILVLFVMDGVLELKALLRHAAAVAAVFAVEPEPITEDRAEMLTAAVMARVRDEVTAAAKRPVH